MKLTEEQEKAFQKYVDNKKALNQRLGNVTQLKQEARINVTGNHIYMFGDDIFQQKLHEIVEDLENRIKQQLEDLTL